MATYKKWSDSEIEYIRNNHTTVCDQELAVKLSQITGDNISTSMIRRQRRKLKLAKPRGRPLKNKAIETQTETPEDVSTV
tara:strand:+ start:652 stop:891 length:240 start_codon:yes stop_codon:yes gene_type:complete